MPTNSIEEYNFNRYFARIIENYRLKNNLSQRELAEKMGVPNSTIARLENGETGVNSTTIEKFCFLSGLQVQFVSETVEKKAFDVADYIIKKCEEILGEDFDVTNMKLQKLLYYVQVYFLGRYKIPMFENEFRAWEHGPVHLSVYHKFKTYGGSPVQRDSEEANQLDIKEIETIDQVLELYGRKSAFELRKQSHVEDGRGINPWKRAMIHGKNEVIDLEAMKELYRSDFELKDNFNK